MNKYPWQPMETAPKVHGHEILICCDCPHMMAVVEWLDAAQMADEDFVSGWYISDGHNDPIWFRANPYMTHWMPLPALPVKPRRSTVDQSVGCAQCDLGQPVFEGQHIPDDYHRAPNGDRIPCTRKS